jgi:F-type H+-transporting ATPase subunit delta
MVKYGENLIKLLIENKRLMVLPAIASHFEELKSVEEGAIEAQIIVAEKPDAKIINNLVSSLEKKFNKKIESNVVVDKSIIGGTKIIVGDSVIDASVKGQLNSLAYTLKS